MFTQGFHVHESKDTHTSPYIQCPQTPARNISLCLCLAVLIESILRKSKPSYTYQNCSNLNHSLTGTMIDLQLLPQSTSKSIKIHHQPDCLPIQTLNPCTECWVRLTHGAWGLARTTSSYCLQHRYWLYSRKIHHIVLKQFHLVNASTSSIAFTRIHLAEKGHSTPHRAILAMEGRS